MSFWRYNNQVHGLASSKLAIEQHVTQADMVIGAVLIPGAAAPKLVSNDLVSRMKPGSVLVDIAVDQGGCFEDTHATTHSDPIYEVHNSIFYCVANMPGAVPNTSTYALTNATMPYAVALANKGWEQACRDDHSLALGLNTHAGQLTNGPVGDAVGIEVGLAGVACLAEPASDPGRAVRTYLDHLAVERGLAANTLSSYRRDLRRYLEFLDGAGVDDLDGVTEQTVADFLVRLREGDPDHPPLSSTSAARTVVAVRGFHKFALADGLAASDPASGVKPPTPTKRLPEGAAAQRRRGDPGGRRGAGHHAGAARPGPARGALRHRRPDLRGGGAGRRRPRHGRRGREAARQGRQGAGRPDRVVRARGGRRLPGPRPPRAGGRHGPRAGRRCSSTPAAGGSPGSPPGRSWSRRPSGPASRPTSRRTRCATRSRPTCSTAAPTSGSSRSCSGTRRSRRRRSTRWSPSTACARCSPRPTRGPATDDQAGRARGGLPGRRVRRGRRLGGRGRARALPAPGRGGHRAARRRQRRARDADRLGQVAGGGRRARRGAGPGRGHLLHRADQGAGEREVLRAVRGLRRRRTSAC